MKNMTLAHITEVCGGIYFGAEEKKTALLTEALDALEDAYDAINEVLLDER